MIQVAAILGILATIDQVCHNPLVKRLLRHWAAGTSNKIDDWVVDALTGSDAEMAVKKLEAVQASYNRLDEAAMATMKTAVPLPDDVLEVLTSETVARMLPGVKE